MKQRQRVQLVQRIAQSKGRAERTPTQKVVAAFKQQPRRQQAAAHPQQVAQKDPASGLQCFPLVPVDRPGILQGLPVQPVQALQCFPAFSGGRDHQGEWGQIFKIFRGRLQRQPIQANLVGLLIH